MNLDDRVTALRELIRETFADRRYEGQITPCDGQWDELDDGRPLYEALNGKKWTEVPTTLLYGLPDGYVLLTDAAFAAFIAAWLIVSLEDINGKNSVREFLSYTFSHTSQQYRILDRPQRETIRFLVNEFAHSETSDFIRRHAVEAAELLTKVENDVNVGN